MARTLDVEFNYGCLFIGARGLANAGIVMKLLDAGQCGVIRPAATSRTECRVIPRRLPLCAQCNAIIRATLYAYADLTACANDTVIPCSVIEPSRALGCTPKFDRNEIPGLDFIDLTPWWVRAGGVAAGIRDQTSRCSPKVIERRHYRLGRPPGGGGHPPCGGDSANRLAQRSARHDL